MFSYLKFILSLLVVSIVFVGCGEENGLLNSSPHDDSGSKNLATQQIVGVAMASLLEGATICAYKDGAKLNCSVTDRLGKFNFDTNKTPDELSLIIDKTIIGDISYSKFKNNDSLIDPITLADGNETIAKKIGIFIHTVAGDKTMQQENLDLSNINLKVSENIAEAIKEKRNIKIELSNESTDLITITSNDEIYKLPEREKAKLYAKASTWLNKNRGKTIKFVDENGAATQGKLEVEDNILYFVGDQVTLTMSIKLEKDGAFVYMDSDRYRVSRLEYKKLLFENSASLELIVINSNTQSENIVDETNYQERIGDNVYINTTTIAQTTSSENNSSSKSNKSENGVDIEYINNDISTKKEDDTESNKTQTIATNSSFEGSFAQTDNSDNEDINNTEYDNISSDAYDEYNSYETSENGYSNENSSVENNGTEEGYEESNTIEYSARIGGFSFGRNMASGYENHNRDDEEYFSRRRSRGIENNTTYKPEYSRYSNQKEYTKDGNITKKYAKESNSTITSKNIFELIKESIDAKKRGKLELNALLWP